MDFCSTTLLAKQYGQLLLSTYVVESGGESTVSPNQRLKNKIFWSLHPTGLDDRKSMLGVAIFGAFRLFHVVYTQNWIQWKFVLLNSENRQKCGKYYSLLNTIGRYVININIHKHVVVCTCHTTTRKTTRTKKKHTIPIIIFWTYVFFVPQKVLSQ